MQYYHTSSPATATAPTDTAASTQYTPLCTCAELLPRDRRARFQKYHLPRGCSRSPASACGRASGPRAFPSMRLADISGTARPRRAGTVPRIPIGTGALPRQWGRGHYGIVSVASTRDDLPASRSLGRTRDARQPPRDRLSPAVLRGGSAALDGPPLDTRWTPASLWQAYPRISGALPYSSLARALWNAPQPTPSVPVIVTDVARGSRTSGHHDSLRLEELKGTAYRIDVRRAGDLSSTPRREPDSPAELAFPDRVAAWPVSRVRSPTVSEAAALRFGDEPRRVAGRLRSTTALGARRAVRGRVPRRRQRRDLPELHHLHEHAVALPARPRSRRGAVSRCHRHGVRFRGVVRCMRLLRVARARYARASSTSIRRIAMRPRLHAARVQRAQPGDYSPRRLRPDGRDRVGETVRPAGHAGLRGVQGGVPTRRWRWDGAAGTFMYSRSTQSRMQTATHPCLFGGNGRRGRFNTIRRLPIP